MDKREIVFDMPNTYGTYRMVCRIGYDSSIAYAWWGHLEEYVSFKRFLFFGKLVNKWVEVDKCWWSKEIDSVEELKKRATAFYELTIELCPRLIKKAVDLK